MGINRYSIRCAGCGESFRLRVTVGPDPEQPFYIACPICHAPTRGRLEYHGGVETTLVIESGEIMTGDPEGRPALTVSADIPCVPSASSMEVHGGSPFLHFSSLIGLAEIDRYNQLSMEMRESLKENGSDLARLTAYYRRGDWVRFDASLRALSGRAEGMPSVDWQREDAIHRLWEMLVVPLLYLDRSNFFPLMKEEWSVLWNDTGAHFNALIDFAVSEVATDSFKACHSDLLSAIERYSAKATAILPGALANMVPAAKQPEVDELRLYRDDFEMLRDLYVNTFEACHKALRWVVGAHNIAARGSADSFVAPVGSNENPPSSLKKYAGLTSARKRLYLQPLSVWNDSWDLLLDRSLRNDFGHASARHDLSSGTLIRDGKTPLGYVRFLQKVHHSGHALMACAGVMKLIRVYAHAPKKPAV